jgi:TPR repeat protein
MNLGFDTHWIRALACATLGAGLVLHAWAAPISAHPIAAAIKRGDCEAAVDLANRGAASNDSQATYLAGRMLEQGMCVQKDFAAAGRFFARASDLGERDSSLAYAAKVGLGDGFEQSYERAGQICRAAGVDPQARLSLYSLGYACTLRSVAGQYLRTKLPAGALIPDSGPLLVEFNPASGELTIRAMPQVARDDPPLGSHLRRPRVDAREKTEQAWQQALAMVPKPEAARLGNQGVELSLDVDMTFEARSELTGAGEAGRSFNPLLRPVDQPGIVTIPGGRMSR